MLLLGVGIGLVLGGMICEREFIKTCDKYQECIDGLKADLPVIEIFNVSGIYG